MTLRNGIVVLSSLALLAACRREDGSPEPRGPEPAAVSGAVLGAAAEAPVVKPPLDRVASNCDDGHEVTTGGDQTPEGPLWEAYRLAVGPDGDEAFAKFFALFASGAPERHVREQIWPRVREHVAKYVRDPAKPAYVLCRQLPVGSDRTRIFVKSFDDRKSDPPSVLVKEKGVWKIDVMTP